MINQTAAYLLGDSIDFIAGLDGGALHQYCQLNYYFIPFLKPNIPRNQHEYFTLTFNRMHLLNMFNAKYEKKVETYNLCDKVLFKMRQVEQPYFIFFLCLRFYNCVK